MESNRVIVTPWDEAAVHYDSSWKRWIETVVVPCPGCGQRMLPATTSTGSLRFFCHDCRLKLMLSPAQRFARGDWRVDGDVLSPTEYVVPRGRRR